MASALVLAVCHLVEEGFRGALVNAGPPALGAAVGCSTVKVTGPQGVPAPVPMESPPASQVGCWRVGNGQNMLLGAAVFRQAWINNDSCRGLVPARPNSFHAIGMCGWVTLRDKLTPSTVSRVAWLSASLFWSLTPPVSCPFSPPPWSVFPTCRVLQCQRQGVSPGVDTQRLKGKSPRI